MPLLLQNARRSLYSRAVSSTVSSFPVFVFSFLTLASFVYMVMVAIFTVVDEFAVFNESAAFDEIAVFVVFDVFAAKAPFWALPIATLPV